MNLDNKTSTSEMNARSAKQAWGTPTLIDLATAKTRTGRADTTEHTTHPTIFTTIHYNVAVIS